MMHRVLGDSFESLSANSNSRPFTALPPTIAHEYNPFFKFKIIEFKGMRIKAITI